MSRASQRNPIRTWPETPTDLGGGLNDKINQSLLAPNETPECLNVDFDAGSVRSSGGAIKFNNQVAPGSCIRTRVDKALTEIQILAEPLGGTGAARTGVCGVPLRSYGYLPYSSDTDIGGRATYEGNAYDGTATFHSRRGRSFEFDVSFRIPPEELLYATPTLGSQAGGGNAALNPPHGFDEALDECFVVLQKGGDRTAPMSWALAVVNVGNGAGMTHLPYPRPSNYALCFIWYDAPQWGHAASSLMRYAIATATDPVAAGTNCTNALRAILIHKYVVPGKRYSVAVQLAMDTGTPGGVAANTAWVGDGKFTVQVSEDAGSASTYSFVESTGVAIGMEAYKGPTDSLAYLCKYGVRYFGRDAGFAGLGYRFAPWMRMGFIPFGMDSAPLRSGGFQMLDCSAMTVTTGTPIYGGGAAYTLTVAHAANDAFVTVSNAFLVDGGNQATDPKGEYTGAGALYGGWDGLSQAQSNPEALRGYRFVLTGDTGVAAAHRGAVLSILSLNDPNPGAGLQFNVLQGATETFSTGALGASDAVIRAFRWHQRDLEIGQIKIYGSPRDFASADPILNGRRALSLHSSISLQDESEPDLDKLIAYWPCDDSGGGLLTEMVMGGSRNGFLCPLGNVTTDGGRRGGKMVFLSGEGEAITLDLSENPIFKREVKKMLGGSSQGFGFEITFVPTEGVNGIGALETLADIQGANSAPLTARIKPRLVPDMVVWDCKDVVSESFRVDPRPLLSLTYRAGSTGSTGSDLRPFRWPMAPSVEVARASDQENQEVVTPNALSTWYSSAAGPLDREARYDTMAPWVGRSVTIQVGVQATAAADVYNVYIALSPKDAWRPQTGDPADAEMQYWTDTEANTTGGSTYSDGYYDGTSLTIRRKDLERSVLTVGGRWNPRGKPGDTASLGLWELGCRMLVDEVRWFVAAPPGRLADYSGGFAISTARNGKLEGEAALPQRELEKDDIFRRLGPAVDSGTVTRDSATVSAPANTAIIALAPSLHVDSPRGGMLIVDGDEVSVQQSETDSIEFADAYLITGSSETAVTLASPYRGPSRDGAVMRVFRLAGYATFQDDVRDKQLLLGAGDGYAVATTTVSDVILTDALWANTGGFKGDWKLRIYSPLGHVGLSDLYPSWVRGLVTERRYLDDGILGIHAVNDKRYAGVRGNIYEGDDRWREDGPNDALSTSLAFRAARIAGGHLVPLHDDRVTFDTVSEIRFLLSSMDAYATYYDARVKLDEIGELQTILWVGDLASDPSLPTQTTATSSSNATTFTSTTVVDGAAWAGLSNVRQGDIATAGAFIGVITGQSDAAGTPYENTLAANTVRVAAWTSSSGAGTPSNGTVVSVIRQGSRTHFWLRLNRGRPEFCLGSTAAFSAAPLKPEKGLFIATARQALEPGRWYHIRFIVPGGTNGTIVQKPYCKIEGKSVAVTVNAVETGLAGNNWFSSSTLFFNSGMDIALGAAHDAVTQSSPARTFSTTARLGDVIPGSRLRGWMHSLAGRLAQVVAARVPGTFTSEPADFDPGDITFNSPGMVLQFEVLTENTGVGHRINDSANQQTGTIYSHPCVSVFHEMGRSNDPVVFSEYGAQLYATNGGKPVVILPGGKAKFAGVPTPLVELDFTTERFPLWKKNERSANNDMNSPVAAALAGATQEQYHYDFRGNAFLTERIQNTSCQWVVGNYFAFKDYVRTRSTDGRRRIWGRGRGAAGGPFLDCIDGRARFGWYDTDLKKEVYVETGDKVFFPGRTHYVYLRKVWPPNDTVEGNWLSSYFTNGGIRRATFAAGIAGTFQVGERVTWTAGGGVAGGGIVTKSYGASATKLDFVVYSGAPGAASAFTGFVSTATGTVATVPIRPMYDMLVVRAFRLFGETANEHACYVDSTFASTVNGGCSTSHVPDTLTLPGGTSASGLVSIPGMTYYGSAAGGRITARFNDGAGLANRVVFHPSMIGMYWEWGTGAGASFIGKRYRITEVVDAAGAGGNDTPNNSITVAAIEPGDSIDFTSIVAAAPVVGGVFYGQALKKSTDFDSSRTPDKGTPEIYLGGNPDQTLSDSGFTSFDGEIWCPAWGSITPSAPLTNALCFENRDSSVAGAATNDPIVVGTDYFTTENYDGAAATAPGALQCDNGLQFFAADVRAYGGGAPTTTIPNLNLQVARSTTPTVTGAAAADLYWEYAQSPEKWADTRYYAVAIYDRAQGIVGNVGKRIKVAALEEDRINPRGSVQITLTRLPVGGKDTEVWVYSSVAGGTDAALYRVAVVERGTFSVAIEKRDDEIASSAHAGNFANYEPPRCSVLRTVGSRMIYGALEVQPDGCMPSRPGAAGLVDATKLFRLPSGTGEEIVGLAAADEVGVIMKRRGLGTFVFNEQGFADPREVAGSRGPVGPNVWVYHNDMLIFLSDKGVVVSYRKQGSTLAAPRYVGLPAETFVTKKLDRRRLRRASVAINHRLQQIVWAVRSNDRNRFDMRLAMQLDDGEHRPVFTKHQLPAVTALASIKAPDGGLDRFIGGTEDGFLVWLDREDTSLVMLGPAISIWGVSRVVTTNTSSGNGVTLGSAGQLDAALEGARGATATWIDAGGSEREALVLWSESDRLHFAEVLPAAIPIGTFSLGWRPLHWETPWLDMGNPERPKLLVYVDLIMEQQPAGLLEWSIYVDRNVTSPVDTGTLDLTVANQGITPVGVRGQRFKLMLKVSVLETDTKFELAQVVWRVADEGQE